MRELTLPNLTYENCIFDKSTKHTKLTRELIIKKNFYEFYFQINGKCIIKNIKIFGLLSIWLKVSLTSLLSALSLEKYKKYVYTIFKGKQHKYYLRIKVVCYNVTGMYVGFISLNYFLYGIETNRKIKITIVPVKGNKHIHMRFLQTIMLTNMFYTSIA